MEKALEDLSDLANTGALKNPLVIKSIESKLPGALKLELPRKETHPKQSQARTRASNQPSSHLSGCIVCGGIKHKRKLYFCRKFRVLKFREVHDDEYYCKPSFLCKHPECENKGAIDHHYYLCPNAEVSRGTMGQKRSKSRTVRGGNERNYTEAQQFSENSPLS